MKPEKPPFNKHRTENLGTWTLSSPPATPTSLNSCNVTIQIYAAGQYNLKVLKVQETHNVKAFM